MRESNECICNVPCKEGDILHSNTILFKNDVYIEDFGHFVYLKGQRPITDWMDRNESN